MNNGYSETVLGLIANPMRLLLVEDEKKLADFIVRGLRAEGFAVDVTYDGATAWHMASGTEYDLIILDLMLPELSGTEVLQPAAPQGQHGRRAGAHGPGCDARQGGEFRGRARTIT